MDPIGCFLVIMIVVLVVLTVILVVGELFPTGRTYSYGSRIYAVNC
jgi:Tfp pilus assembly protein PilX